MRAMYKQFNVRDIAPMAAGGLPHLGYGFAIADLHGSPLLSVMYRSCDETIEARETIAAILAKAIAVVA